MSQLCAISLALPQATRLPIFGDGHFLISCSRVQVLRHRPPAPRDPASVTGVKRDERAWATPVIEKGSHHACGQCR